MSEADIAANLLADSTSESLDESATSDCQGAVARDLVNCSSAITPGWANVPVDVRDSTTVATGAANRGRLEQLCAQLRQDVDKAYEIVAEEAREYYDTLSALVDERKRMFIEALEAQKQRAVFVDEVETFVKDHGKICESESTAVEAVLKRLLGLVSLTKTKTPWFGIEPNTSIVKKLSSQKDNIFINPVFSCFFHTKRIEQVVGQLNSIIQKKSPEPLSKPAEKAETEAKITGAPEVAVISGALQPAAESLGALESVRILCVKSPQEFYVLRRSDKELWLLVNSHFQKEIQSLTTPDIVEMGQIYAVYTSDEDCCWYRGRAGRRCGCYYVGSVAHPLYDFFLVDRGSSADIRLSDVRNLNGDLLSIPPLAKPCSLSGICPREGSSWSRESCQELLDVVTKGHVGMRTLHEDGGVYHVDLSVVLSDEKSIPSVRDWLLLRRLASLPSSGKEPHLKQLASQAKHIRRRETFQAVASYCESPGIVYFQRMDQAERILDLQLQLQETYSNPTTSYTAACFDPRKGLLCASLYEGEYYRALVEDIDQDGRIAIFYVDYGNREKVYAGQLRDLAPRFTEMEAQAIRCSIKKAGTSSQFENLMAQVANSALCALRVITVLKGHVGRVRNKKECCLIVEIKLVDEGASPEPNLAVEADLAAPGEAQQLDTMSPVPRAAAESLDPVSMEDVVDVLVESREESNEVVKPLVPVDLDVASNVGGAQRNPEIPARQDSPSASYDPAAVAAVEADPTVADPAAVGENHVPEELSPLDEYALQCLYKHSDSPSLIYVVPPHLEVKFQELDDRMQDFYKDRHSLPFSSLVVGSEYCVKVKESFCRGRINHIADEDSISVFLIDYGKKIITSAGRFLQLEDEHRPLPSGLITCELFGIEPVSFCWTEEAVAAVDSILAESACVYLRAREKPRRLFLNSPASLPVELTLETPGADNQPIRFSLNEYLVRRGWAKFTQSQEIVRWIPAVAPRRDIFDGLVTWITNEGTVFIQDNANADLVIEMSRRLKGRFQDSQPDPDVTWARGDVCIAWFDGDDGWHRATLVGCPPQSYRVLFVDFGTCLESAVEELRKPPGFVGDVPIQAWECRLHNIVPPNGADTWPVAVLDQVHALLIEKSCKVRVHDLRRNPPFDVSLTLSDGRDVGSVLVEMGLASVAPKLEIAPCPLPLRNEEHVEFPVMVAQVKSLCLTVLPDVGTPVDEEVEKLSIYEKWVEARQKVDQMDAELIQRPMKPLKDCSEGTVCLVRNEGQISRAVVLETSDRSTAKLELVDLGTVVEERAASDLFQLPPKYINIPRLSFTVRLDGLKVAPGVSMETATRKLSKAAIKYPLWASFKGENDGGIPLIDLLAFDAEQGKKCLAYEDYVKKGIFQHQ